jgi:hypothetical protein
MIPLRQGFAGHDPRPVAQVDLDGHSPRTPPTPFLIEPFPTGMVALAALEPLAFRIAELAQGRPVTLRLANAGWPGFDTFPLWNVRGGTGAADWLCGAGIGDRDLADLTNLLAAAGVTVIPQKDS